MLANLICYLGVDTTFSILILDSSDDVNFEINARNINNNFMHIRYENNIRFKEKLADGLQRVSTKYCVFCADDDIVSPESLSKCVEFLESNSDYVGAQGYYFGFEGRNGKYIVDDIIYNNNSIDAQNPLSRLDRLFTNYQSNFYSVFRTEVQITAISEASKIENSLFFELMQSSYGVIKGKVKRLPIIYAGRSRTASVDVPRQWHPIEWVSVDIGDYFTNYIYYRNILLLLLEKNIEGNYDNKKLNNILDLIHAKYTFASLGIDVLQSSIDAQINFCDDDEIIARAFSVSNEESNLGSYLFKNRLRQIMPLWLLKISKKIIPYLKQKTKLNKKRHSINKKIIVEFNDIVLEKIIKDNISLTNATESIYKILEKYN